MGSKGRMPPPHLRHPLPGPGIIHHDHFGPGISPPPGLYPPFDMLPPPEVMERKLASQLVEMQRLATENQRLAATHGTLRQELAAAQHELQVLHAHIGAVKAEREQQVRDLTDKITKMEAELKTAEPVRSELKQARAEAENLVVARRELMSKVHQLNQDLSRVHEEVQQIPALMSELESLRQEYQRCRVSYDYEKKLFSDHLNSLQVMEKNYVTMAREVDKLRAELTNVANVDMRTVAGGPYGGATGNNENEASGRPIGQNVYDDGYGVPQGQWHTGGSASNSGAAVGTITPTYAGAWSGSAPSKPSFDAQKGCGYEVPKGPSYDTSRVPNYDAHRGHSFDPQRGAAYEVQRGPTYDMQRGPGYDIHRLPSYDALRGPVYDMQQGPSYDASRGTGYDVMSRGATGPHGQVVPGNMSYGSATPPPHAGNTYEASGRGGNSARR